MVITIVFAVEEAVFGDGWGTAAGAGLAADDAGG